MCAREDECRDWGRPPSIATKIVTPMLQSAARVVERAPKHNREECKELGELEKGSGRSIGEIGSCCRRSRRQRGESAAPRGRRGGRRVAEGAVEEKPPLMNGTSAVVDVAVEGARPMRNSAFVKIGSARPPRVKKSRNASSSRITISGMGAAPGRARGRTVGTHQPLGRRRPELSTTEEQLILPTS